ncbi:MAG: hypothetical protein KOO60_08370 [Gemmatimonadales bacterium]|nr:hypothetical protein [Gemmatimonadales bacterium]
MTVYPTVTDRFPQFCFIVLVFLGLLSAGAVLADQYPAERISGSEETPLPEKGWAPANRESLYHEIERYSQEIATLKDSLGVGELDFHLDERHRERLHNSISDFSGIIEDIGQELSRLDFEISQNRISLIDESGEGITINIPENLDDRLSEGMQALSQMILADLPDSNVLGLGRNLNISSLFQTPRQPERRVIQGNVVKISDDVHITPMEDLRGDLVVVMGDAAVSGRVDGDVVVVFGNLLLDEDCEVTGKVVCILGRLDREPTAEVGDLVVIDPWPSGDILGDWGRWNEGVLAFLVSQSLFLAVLVFVVIVIGVAPGDKLNLVLASLRDAPLQCLGLGILAGFGLHIVSVVLVAVLVLTVVGLPLALLLGIGLGLVAALAIALAAAVTGEKLCGLIARDCKSLWLAVVVGLIALHSVSFCGGVLGAFTSVSGLSTLLLILGWGIKTMAYFLGIGGLVKSQIWRRNAA